MLEKNYHANAGMATVLIAVSYWPLFFLRHRGPVISITMQGTAGDIEDPVNRGHCQWDAVTQVQLRNEELYSVLKQCHLATCCTARLWVENFVGGKFRDLSMSHENNENWHPTKITRYTVCCSHIQLTSWAAQ